MLDDGRPCFVSASLHVRSYLVDRRIGDCDAVEHNAWPGSDRMQLELYEPFSASGKIEDY
jgi:hypothetical protein